MRCVPRSAVRLAALALCALALPAAAIRTTPGSDGSSELVDILCRCRAGDATERAAAERDLERFPAERASAVLDVLFYATPLPGPDGSEAPLDGATEARLFGLLRSWPEPGMLDSIRSRAEGSLRDTVRALEVIGASGGAHGVSVAVDLIGALDPSQAAQPLVIDAFGALVQHVLERDPAAAGDLDRRLTGSDPALLAAAAGALGRIGRGPGRRLLEDMLDLDQGLEPAVLKALGSWKRWDAEAPACATLVGGYLDSHSPEICRAAATAAGALRSWNAVPALLDLLKDSDRGVLRAAREALREIAGRRDDDDLAVWSDWYHAEQSWLSVQVEPLLAEVQGGDPAHALDALRELGAHPWFADQLVAEVAPLLHDSHVAVASAACDVLLRFGSPEAAQALADALDDERPAVRDAAAAALGLLTGADLPHKPGPWRELLRR